MVNTKRATETFIVANGVTTLKEDGTVNNSSTLNVNLTENQIGFANDSLFNGTYDTHEFVATSVTVAEAPILKLYQGTAASANILGASANGPLAVEPYIATNPINGNGTVKVTKQAYRDPQHNVWVVGSAAGSTDDINVLSNTVYSIAVGFRGRRIQETHSLEEAATLHAHITTPDFSATGLNLNNAQAIDWITTNLAYNINRNSYLLNMNSRFPANWPVLALLIDTTGATGTPIGGVTPIAENDVIAVVNTSTGTRNVTLTKAMADSIKAAAVTGFGDVIANVTWSIVTIDLSEAGEIATSKGEAIMLIALDEKTAYKDRIPQVKTSISVGLTAGFDYNTVYNTELNYSDEGEGLARQLQLFYENTHGQRKYNLRHTEDPIIEYPNPIADGGQYTVYNILHGNQEQIDTFNVVYSPYRELVCIPASNTTLISSVDTLLNTWLASAKNNSAVLSLD